MSAQSPGPGWWQASDGKWYAPEQHPSFIAEHEPAVPAPVAAVPPAPGWWQASDGNWYSPEQHPSVSEAAPVTELPDIGDLGDLAELAELASSAAGSAGAPSAGAPSSQPLPTIDEPELEDSVTTGGEGPGPGSAALEGASAVSQAPGGVSTGERATPDPDEWLMKGRGSKGGKRWRRRGS